MYEKVFKDIVWSHTDSLDKKFSNLEFNGDIPLRCLKLVDGEYV